MEQYQQDKKMDKISRLDLVAIGIALCLTTFVTGESAKIVVGLGSYIAIRWYQVSSGQDVGQ